MRVQIVLRWPEVAVLRADDGAGGQGLEQAGDVGIDADGAGSDDGVAVGHSQHPLVEPPVAEAAEGHAVADVVVLALAPRDDVRGFHHRVAVGGDDADAAQGAAVVVGRGHHLAEPLVTGRRFVLVRFDDLLDQRQVGFFFQQPAVVEGLAIDQRLFLQGGLGFRGEAGEQECFPQGFPPCPALHDAEQFVIEFRAEGVVAQVADGGGIVDDRIRDGLPWLGDKFPERLVVQAGERESDTAGLTERDDAPPVEVEQIVQFDQVAGDIDEWCGYDASMHLVKHRQQQDRLVRRPTPGGAGPDLAGGTVEAGEVLYVRFQCRHLSQYAALSGKIQRTPPRGSVWSPA